RLPRLVPEQPEQTLAQTDAPTLTGGQRAWQDLRDGFSYLKNQRVLWILLWLNLLIQLALGPFMLVYIVVNNNWFGGGYNTLALCEVSFFIGVVACSAMFEKFRVTRPGLAFIIGVAFIGITIIFMGGSKNVWAFAAWNVVCGLAFPFIQLPMAAYIQKLVPQNFQGRVNAAMTMTGMGVIPVAIGLGGLLLAKIGAANMLYAMGAGMSVAGLLGLADRQFRTVRTDDAPVPNR
ncbi:MAG: MFS transporter, partial [Armatimonadetes bacterium]|nr:MFS transporter [Armatimonadota bacterium]